MNEVKGKKKKAIRSHLIRHQINRRGMLWRSNNLQMIQLERELYGWARAIYEPPRIKNDYNSEGGPYSKKVYTLVDNYEPCGQIQPQPRLIIH